MVLPRVTEIAQTLVKRCLRPGDRAVDATVGNGHDTLFLAERVAPGGTVDGFDLQEEAIRMTRERVRDFPGVRLHRIGHENMAEVVAPGVKAVMFNLGYLPGGEKSIVTRAETTLPALGAALDLLAVGGLLTVVAYPGHPGGEAESDSVVQWAEGLAPGPFRVVRYGPLSNAGGTASPFLLAVQRSESI